MKILLTIEYNIEKEEMKDFLQEEGAETIDELKIVLKAKARKDVKYFIYCGADYDFNSIKFEDGD